MVSAENRDTVLPGARSSPSELAGVSEHFKSLGFGFEATDSGVQRYAIHIGNCTRSDSRTGGTNAGLTLI
jgi:hypothetical protein